MADKPETFWSRLKRFTLWQWGLLLIFGALVTQVLMSLVHSPTGRMTSQQRAEALGRGAAMLLLIIAGVVLIILHFVRRKR